MWSYAIPRADHVRCVVDRVALWPVSPLYFIVPLPIIIPEILHVLICHARRWNRRPQSRPISRIIITIIIYKGVVHISNISYSRHIGICCNHILVTSDEISIYNELHGNRVLPMKLIISQLIKKCSAYLWNTKFLFLRQMNLVSTFSSYLLHVHVNIITCMSVCRRGLDWWLHLLHTLTHYSLLHFTVHYSTH
jgi:hypothetical protein